MRFHPVAVVFHGGDGNDAWTSAGFTKRKGTAQERKFFGSRGVLSDVDTIGRVQAVSGGP